jgi:hypothetical protein
MHKHLIRIVTRPAAPVPRPAKVVSLDARRQARLERAPQAPQPPTLRPAA